MLCCIFVSFRDEKKKKKKIEKEHFSFLSFEH